MNQTTISGTQSDELFTGEDLSLQPTTTEEVVFDNIDTPALTNEAMLNESKASGKPLASKATDISDDILHLLDDDKATILNKYNNNEIDDTQVSKLILYHKIKADPNGIYGLSKKDTIEALDTGLISEDTTQHIIEYHQALNDTEPSVGRKVLGSLMWVARPFGALGSAAVAPIGHEYTTEGFINQTIEAFKASGKAFYGEMVPTWNVERPDYEGKIIDRYIPNMPEKYKPAAGIAIALLSDPSMEGLVFMKSLRAGLAASAMSKTEAGPWRNAIEEMVSIVPMKEEDLASTIKLADMADSGDIVAAKKLVAQEYYKEVDAAGLDDITLASKAGPTSTEEIAPLMKAVRELTSDPEKAFTQISELGPEGRDLIEAIVKEADTAPKVEKVIEKSTTEYADELKRLGEGLGIFGETSAKILKYSFRTKEDLAEAVRRAQIVYDFTYKYEPMVRKAISKALSETGTSADRALAFDHTKRLAALSKYVEDIGSSFGKGLEAHKLSPINNPANTTLGTTQRAVLTASNDQEVTKVLEYIQELPTTTDVIKASKLMDEHKPLKGLLEYMQAAMLSDPSTQIVNAAAGAMVTGHKVLVRSLALAGEGAWNTMANLFRAGKKSSLSTLHIANNMEGLYTGFKNAVRLPSYSRV